MNKFKKGDTVIRIPGTITDEFTSYCNEAMMLTIDTFVVEEVGDVWIKLCGVGFRWDATKFDLASPAAAELTNQAVVAPSHYQFFPELEAIEVIASTLTLAEFRGYCLGNRLKYRLRAGKKDKLEQDIQKSDFYVELFEKHKHLCKG